MVSFAQPLFWQIRYLVVGLSKKNCKSSVSELHQLINLYGYDAQVFFLRTLVEEIELREMKQGTGGGRELLKLNLLQAELREIENEDQFGAVLCQAIEGSRDGVMEDFLTHFCKVLKMPMKSQLALGVACRQSTNEVTHREGMKFLKARLREYCSSGSKAQRLPEVLLHSIVALLRSADMAEVLEERDREGLVRQLCEMHPDVDVNKGPCAGLLHVQRLSAARLARHDWKSAVIELPPITSSGNHSDGARACDLLEELGHAFSSQMVRDVLAMFPDIGTLGLAEIVSMLVRTANAPVDPHCGLAAGVFAATVHDAWSDPSQQVEAAIESAADGDSKDILGLIEEVKACVPSADWTQVFEYLFELPDFRLPDAHALQVMFSLHRATCGESTKFPIMTVLQRRRCSATQLQFLRHAIQAEAGPVDFTHPSVELIKPIPGLPGVEDEQHIGGPNHCWACPQLIEALFELADIEDYGAVRSLFESPMSTMPEALLVVICLAEDRTRGTLRAELLERLVPPLFDTEGEHSTRVQVALAERAPTQLKLLLKGMQERDPEKNLPRIMDILRKDEPEIRSFYLSLLHGRPTELSCELALLGESRNEIELASWLRRILTEHKDTAAVSFVRFLRNKFQAISGADDSSEHKRATPPLPAGIHEMALGQSYLEALQEALPHLTQQSARQIADLMHFLHHRFPALAPLPPPEAPPSVAPPPPSEPPPHPPPPPQPVAPEMEGQRIMEAPREAPPPPPPDLAATLPPVAAGGDVSDSSPVRGGGRHGRDEDVDEDQSAANVDSLLNRMYQGFIPVSKVIELMLEYKSRPDDSREKGEYHKMTSFLFDECRFFPKYPAEELRTTGELMGQMMNCGLVSDPALVTMALRCLLEALRRPRGSKMFRFGITALENMLAKLPNYPQLCQHIVTIEGVAEAHPAYLKYAHDVLACLPPDRQAQQALSAADLEGIILPQVPEPPVPIPPPTQAPPPPAAPPGPPSAQPPPPSVAPPPPSSPVPDAQGLSTAVPPQPPPKAPPPRGAAGVCCPTVAGTAPPAGPPPPPTGVPDLRPPAEPVPAGLQTQPPTTLPAAGGGSLMLGGANTVDSLLNDPEFQIEKPPVWFSDQTAQLFNSLVKDNVEQKAEELGAVLAPEYQPWFAFYLVKNRATKEANFHAIYIELLEKLRQPRLMELTTSMTYECLRMLLKSVDQAVVSTSHRTVLKNLGNWLGQITLSRNKPLKAKQFDMKQALLEAYETGRLTAVLPLVCKVLEGVQKSKVYKLPNPWTSAIMSLLAEIHDVPALRTNLMFEVEVLCKHLDIKIQDLPRSELLKGKRPPPSSHDLSNAAKSSSVAQASPPAKAAEGSRPAADATGMATHPGAAGGSSLRQEAPAWPGTALSGMAGYHHYGSDGMLQTGTAMHGGLQGSGDCGAGMQHAGLQAGLEHEFMIPQMPSLVTIPNHPFFTVQHRHLKSHVPVAVDRALREVVCAVVERTVMIACLNTREMVQKDFAVEGDEKLVHKAAQLMVASVAGSLALTTVREPLRVSLQNHLRNMLFPHVAPKDDALEQVVRMATDENMELGCSLIEKAVVDKALKDIEESIAPAIQARKQHKLRSHQQPFYDIHFYNPAAKWPNALPECLRPMPGPPGNTPSNHLKVYKDFNNMPFNGINPRSPNLPLLDMRGGRYYTAQGMEAEYLEPEESMEVNNAVVGVLAAIDATLQAMIADPPLLPPVDPVTLNIYKQDDAIDAFQSLSLLPLNSDLVVRLRQIPHRVGQSGQPESCALELTTRVVKRMYEAPQLVSQVRPPDSISPIHMVTEVYLAILDILRETLKDQMNKVLIAGIDDITGRGNLNVDVVSGLVRYSLITSSDLDRLMPKWLERPRDPSTMLNLPMADYCVLLIQRLCIRQRVVNIAEMTKTVEALSRVYQQARQSHSQYPAGLSIMEVKVIDSIAKLLEEIRTLENYSTEKKKQTLSARLVERLEEDNRTRGTENQELSKDTIIRLFEDWYAVNTTSPEGRDLHTTGRQGHQVFSSYLQCITSSGVLRGEESIERFLRISCEHAVQRAFTSSKQPQEDDQRSEKEREGDAPATASEVGAQEGPPVLLNFHAVDIYAKLISLLMKYSDKVQMLSKALNAIAKALIHESETKDRMFNQRPYLRILLNLMLDMSNPDPAMEQVNFQVLVAFCNVFNQINPLRLPNFAYAWLELVSNRMFMPKLLSVKGHRGWPFLHRFVTKMLYFLEPYLRHVQLNDNIRSMYKGTVRMLMVLLHEYPEFVCDFHYSLIESIPQCCVQLKNLILSANPRNMKLPDPLSPSLKVDRLQEAKVAPRLFTDYTSVVLYHGVKFDIDNYVRTRDRKLLEVIKDKLILPKNESAQLESRYNIPLLNALVLYVGVGLPQTSPLQSGMALSQSSPPLEIFMYLANFLDYEGRYYFCSSMANHLRYPNAHTFYFSCTLLYLFGDAKEDAVREQIARVLLERLIVHRPHPWGLLITFIELTRNELYDFWNRPFLKVAPEVEKLFKSVTSMLGLSPEQRN